MHDICIYTHMYVGRYVHMYVHPHISFMGEKIHVYIHMHICIQVFSNMKDMCVCMYINLTYICKYKWM